MGKMSLDIIFQKTNFIIGIIGMVLSILWLATLRINKRKVITSKVGKKRFQPDLSVGTAIISLIVSIMLLCSSFGYAFVGLIIIAIIIIVFAIVYFENFKVIMRAVWKTIKAMIKGFINFLASIFKGVTRKK